MWSAPQDKAGILQQLDPARDVDRIILALLGLTSTTDKTGSLRLSRISQPVFTYEYVMQLQGMIEGFLSFTTQVSRWEEARIREHTRQATLALLRNIATHGDDNYISSASWSRILEISYLDKQNGKETGNGWEAIGHTWHYNDPVRYDMLKLVRSPNEEADQGLIFGTLLRQFAALIEGSLAKGFAQKHNPHGMLPSLLGEIHNESLVVRDQMGEKTPTPIIGGKDTWN